MQSITYTFHATVERMAKFGLKPDWVERAVREPDWTESDPQPGVERRFRATPEFGGRILRVVCIEEEDHIRVISVFPDGTRNVAMTVKTTHDPEADAVYIDLSDERPVESEEVAPGVVLDFTADGRVTGIEILFASKTLAPGDWRKAPRPGGAKAHAAE